MAAQNKAALCGKMIARIFFALALTASRISANPTGDKHIFGACKSREEAESVASARFNDWLNAAISCNYQKAITFNAPGASYVLSEACEDLKCCLHSGDMDSWWNFYGCYDNLQFPQPREMRWLRNGTIVFSYDELQGRKDGTTGYFQWFYSYDAYWHPVPGKCDFKLGYLLGAIPTCPKDISGLTKCELC